METVLERSYGVDEIEVIALELKKLLPRCKVMTFQGTLGAGKTTLVGELLRACGVKEVVTSPTFTYVNSYRNAQGDSFYHFDCYRLDSAQAFLDVGFDEYLYFPHSWSFIEWPEIIEPLLKTGVCRVFLDYDGVENRRIKVLLS
jgi:tRNA threonylcarbamoyladenosine biosynthesis protein TsaE